MNIFVWLEPYFIATDYVHVCYTHYGSIKIIRDLAELNDFRQKLYLNPNATDICQSKSAREGGGVEFVLGNSIFVTKINTEPCSFYLPVCLSSSCGSGSIRVKMDTQEILLKISFNKNVF